MVTRFSSYGHYWSLYPNLFVEFNHGPIFRIDFLCLIHISFPTRRVPFCGYLSPTAQARHKHLNSAYQVRP
jgi:hypothetical protein